MSINLGIPETTKKLKPRVLVLGVGGGGCNALNTMIASKLKGVEFVACNTDFQSLEHCNASHKIQLGIQQTQGLGAGSDPSIGKSAAEESYNEICEYIDGAHMAFIAAGMGGGTGTGAVSTIAKACKEKGILTVAVVTKPFAFEGVLRMENAEKGIEDLREHVDTLIVIPNQNLFILGDEKTQFSEALCMADQVLHAGVRGITDLMFMPGLINLDFADVKAVMSEMGRAVLGNGEAAGERRAIEAAEAAISNPLLDHVSLQGAKGLLLNISGGSDMSLTEVDEAADRIKQEVASNAKIIFGSSINKEIDGIMRVSIVATGIDNVVDINKKPKKEEKVVKDNLFANNKVEKKSNAKFAEQTDLEDFTNPIIEVQRDTDFSRSNDKIAGKIQENQQKKPSNQVVEFIKKFSLLKIFNFKKDKETLIKDEESKKENNMPLNDELKIEKEEEKVDFKIEKEPEVIIEKKEPEVAVEKKEPEVKIKMENEEKTNNEKKTVQIQSEMPGLDTENSEKKDDKKTNDKEDLEIPSFLRNQSN